MGKTESLAYREIGSIPLHDGDSVVKVEQDGPGSAKEFVVFTAHGRVYRIAIGVHPQLRDME